MGKAALFLDRDGVINRERGSHTWRIEDFQVLPDVAQAMNAVHAAGKSVIIVSNQSGIGLGLYGIEDVERLHAYLHAELAREGAYFDDVYYCPHHPEQGRCLCRKPGGLLFERALARHHIDADLSLMIGDRERDITAAATTGIRGVLVPANTALLPVLKNERMI